MSFRAIVYAYIIGGFTLVPLLLAAAIAWTVYTSVPVADPDPTKSARAHLTTLPATEEPAEDSSHPVSTNDQPRTRKGWLTVRRTFEEKETDGSYVGAMRSFLNSRSKDPKRSRPKDMWYVVLKGNVLYLYEDEAMAECEAAIHLTAHDVVVFPEGLMDAELFTKRNAICLKPLVPPGDRTMPSATREMTLESIDVEKKVDELAVSGKAKQVERQQLVEVEKKRDEARDEALDPSTPWFIFVRSCVEMEDWYHALVHASSNPANTPTLAPLLPVFEPADMLHLVSTLDEQPDVIPMRWLNALIGRLFFSLYRTDRLEKVIIGRLMKKLSKVKTPTFLQNINVTEVSVGNTAPTLSKPMLKELTQEGDAALEVRLVYKGEIRITVEATAIISLGQRFKSYTVKLVLACVLRELEGNLLVKVKRPPSNRLWYAFTQPPTMVLDVEPVVSDRQIKWGMILSTMEARLKEVIYESVVMPNMDDIAFFESNDYEFRGGIYADARRKPHTTLSASPAVPLEDSTSSSVEPVPVVQKAHSTDDVPDIRASEPHELAQVPRAETLAVLEASAVVTPKQRSVSPEAHSDQPPPTECLPNSVQVVHEADDAERGRSGGADGSTSRRALSVPPESGSVSSLEQTVTTQPRETASVTGNGGWLSPDSMPASRSSVTSISQSSSRSRSLSSSADFQTSSTDTSVPSTPAQGSSVFSGNINHGQSSTSSFLSSLKAKAADKQALSNTAKEAMRKWSANWSGFKRDSAGSNSSVEEPADAGSLHHASNHTPTLFSQSRRGNYADIRAAVAERRVRTVSTERQAEPASTTPVGIPIPGKSKEEERVDDLARSISPTPSRDGSSSLSSSTGAPQLHRTPSKPSLLRVDATKVSPSAPRVSTDLHTPEPVRDYSGGKPASVQDNAPIARSPSPSIQAAPIHRQPSQGASMTIPGIHARHRGEVMSMGYAPPSAPAPPTPESKLKTPAIQSVYRLFKSPILSGQQAPQEAPPSPSPVPEGAETGLNMDVTPLRLSSEALPTPAQPSKPAPPPLPPRSVTKTTPPAPPPPSGLPSATPEQLPSSASEALKSIASKDDSKRQSLELASGRTSMSGQRGSLGAKRLSGLNFDELVVSSSMDNPEYQQSKVSEPEDIPDDDPWAEASALDVIPVELQVEPRRGPPPLPPRRSSTVLA